MISKPKICFVLSLLRLVQTRVDSIDSHKWFEFKSKTNTTDYAYKRLEIDDLLLTTNLEDEAASVEAELQQEKKTDNTLGKEVTKIGCFKFSS